MIVYGEKMVCVYVYYLMWFIFFWYVFFNNLFNEIFLIFRGEYVVVEFIDINEVEFVFVLWFISDKKECVWFNFRYILK